MVDATTTALVALKDVATWIMAMNVSAAVGLGMGRRAMVMKGGVTKALVKKRGSC